MFYRKKEATKLSFFVVSDESDTNIVITSVWRG